MGTRAILVAILLALTTTACNVVNEGYCCVADCPGAVEPCNDPTRPYCDEAGDYGAGHSCIADPLATECDGPNDCSDQRPYCLEMVCVQCTQNSECTAATPVCDEDSHLCGVCSGDPDCTGRIDATRCDTESGACVQCLEATDCSDLSAPVCDETDHACRGCEADSECDSQVCDETSGMCLAEADIIYIAMTGSGTACTSASPCGTFAAGLAQVTTTRKTIKAAAGTYSGQILINGIEVVIVAHGATAQPPGGSTSVVEVSNGADATIEGLTVTGTTGTGSTVAVRCLDTSPSSTMRLFGTRVVANLGGGGVSIANCEFSLINNLIATNGATTSTFGGVRITDVASAGEHEFAFNTVTGNAGAINSVTGVLCSAISPVLTFGNNIVYDNPVSGTGTQVGGDSECDWVYSDIGPQAEPGTGNINMSPMFVDAGGNNFHLMAGSPAKDAADPAATETRDIDGDVRPQGDARDMGSDEVVE